MKGKGWTCVCCWPSKGWWRWWSRHILEPRSPVWKSFWWGLISPGFQQRPQIAETFRNIFSDVTCCSQLQLPAAPEDLEHWCLCQTQLCAPSNSSDGKINENLRRITSQVKEYLYISYMLVRFHETHVNLKHKCWVDINIGSLPSVPKAMETFITSSCPTPSSYQPTSKT